MPSVNRSRRSQASVQSDPSGASEYELVELLIPDKEIAGQKPFPLGQWEEEKEARISAPRYIKTAYSPDNDEGASKVGTTGRMWRARRRRDGKVSFSRLGGEFFFGGGGPLCMLFFFFWLDAKKKGLALIYINQVFLATEYVDHYKIMDEAKETLLRLLNHPNLISLVDVVQDTKVGLESSNYTVWEDCVGGTLNRLLFRENEEKNPV